MNDAQIPKALVLAAVITLLSLLYSRASTGEYCSPDPSLNAKIDCSLTEQNRGLPLAYLIVPDFQPRHGLQPLPLVADFAAWSVASIILIYLIRRVKA